MVFVVVIGLIVGLFLLWVKGVYLVVVIFSVNFIIIFLIEFDVFVLWIGGKIGLIIVDFSIFGWVLDM